MRYLQVGLTEVAAGPKCHQFLLFRNSSKFWPSIHLHAELKQQQSQQLGLKIQCRGQLQHSGQKVQAELSLQSPEFSPPEQVGPLGGS